MAMEMGLWRADGGKLTRLNPTGVPLESQLEDYIEHDPTLLGEPLMIIGRQVHTLHGGFIDLLAVDGDGVVHVLELKRDKTPRDVTAQTLDYGSWIASLSRAEILDIWADYKPGVAFEEAFAEAFGDQPPEDLNDAQVLTVVAATVDDATERIVRFLNETYNVPLNVVFFRYYEDNGTSYLARTWLVDHEVQPDNAPANRARKSKEPWNGHDWYVSFGGETRDWDDATQYGFVSAGGGRWYSQTLRKLPPGARIFVYIPGTGYCGVGEVTRAAVRFDEAVVDVDGAEVRLAGQNLRGSYGKEDASDEEAEYAVAVDWIHTVPTTQAVRKNGIFASQHSACKLRSQFTIDQVCTAFGLSG